MGAFLVSGIGVFFVFYHYYFSLNENFVYLGFAFLVVSGVWSSVLIKKLSCFSEVKKSSEVTCPKCGFKKKEVMLTDSCQFFWECPGCEEILKPLEGDCCVYCSYGSVPCPPIQLGDSCCA